MSPASGTIIDSFSFKVAASLPVFRNLRDSSGLHEIVEVLKIFTDGQALVDFLQLEGA